MNFANRTPRALHFWREWNRCSQHNCGEPNDFKREKKRKHAYWLGASKACMWGRQWWCEQVRINTSGEEIHALHACATQGKAKVRPIPLPPTSGWPPGEVEMSAARTRRSTAREMTAVGCRKWRVKWACLWYNLSSYAEGLAGWSSTSHSITFFVWAAYNLVDCWLSQQRCMVDWSWLGVLGLRGRKRRNNAARANPLATMRTAARIGHWFWHVLATWCWAVGLVGRKKSTLTFTIGKWKWKK